MSGPKAKNPEDRFFAKVQKTETCWIWTGAKSRDGYGDFGIKDQKWKTVKAHRWIWTQLKGPIPESHELDHLCRNRACVNPEHLEPVSRRENQLRGEGAAGQNAKKTH